MFKEREEACGVKEVVGLKAREGQTRLIDGLVRICFMGGVLRAWAIELNSLFRCLFLFQIFLFLLE